VYRDSGLSEYPRHYLGVGDLPIKVSHSFASLMLFVHLHIIYLNWCLSCHIYGPVFEDQSSIVGSGVATITRSLEGQPL
jgi:hypothetical protein